MVTVNAPLPPIAILAGGLATRLRPVTETIPKALIELQGRPFIAWQLELLRSRGIREVVICCGYLGEMIESVVGGGEDFGVRVRYSCDGPKLLGTGGAVRQALPMLGESFFVIYGDSYLPCDYQAAANAFKQSGASALMTVFRNAGRWDTSNVEMKDGRIVAYDKRNRTASMEYIDYGLGVFARDIFSCMSAETSFDLAQVYGELLRQGRLSALEVPERFYEAGSFEGIEELKSILRRKAHSLP